MTNPHKLPFYHRYMREKYGDRYWTKEEFAEYWDNHWSRVARDEDPDEK
jgi:hypothetical protein